MQVIKLLFVFHINLSYINLIIRPAKNLEEKKQNFSAPTFQT